MVSRLLASKLARHVESGEYPLNAHGRPVYIFHIEYNVLLLLKTKIASTLIHAAK